MITLSIVLEKSLYELFYTIQVHINETRVFNLDGLRGE